MLSLRENSGSCLILYPIFSVLRLRPEDTDAIHCKAISLIRLEKYQSALDLLSKNIAENQLATVRAYCLYRLNRWNEVLSIARKFRQAGNNELGLKHLEAQAVCII